MITHSLPVFLRHLQVSIWIRSNIAEESDANLEWAFDIVTESLKFAEDYFNVSSTAFPTKLGKDIVRVAPQIERWSIRFFYYSDLIGVPDLVLDEKASSSWGLLLFREEFLSVDPTLNSAERIQTTAKVIGEHILQVVRRNTVSFAANAIEVHFSGYRKSLGGIRSGLVSPWHPT